MMRAVPIAILLLLGHAAHAAETPDLDVAGLVAGIARLAALDGPVAEDDLVKAFFMTATDYQETDGRYGEKTFTARNRDRTILDAKISSSQISTISNKGDFPEGYSPAGDTIDLTLGKKACLTDEIFARQTKLAPVTFPTEVPFREFVFPRHLDKRQYGATVVLTGAPPCVTAIKFLKTYLVPIPAKMPSSAPAAP